VRANRNANLVVKKCEIHAIVGENGAGKSTLMNTSMVFNSQMKEKSISMIKRFRSLLP
jgi:ABC-type uncharacterized transport system ATPase subunit